MATKQRWYCRNCGGRYFTKFGVLIEWKLQGVAHYLLGELPPDHIWDIKGMIVESRFTDQVKSAKELFDIIPDMVPVSEKYFRPRTGLGWKTGKSLDGALRNPQYGSLVGAS